MGVSAWPEWVCLHGPSGCVCMARVGASTVPSRCVMHDWVSCGNGCVMQ